MKSENVIQLKSYAFAIRIVKLCRYLGEQKREFILSKQLIRSGTSIGSNVEESIGAQSRKDFIAKLSISYKETRETLYWLRLLMDTDYLSKKEAMSIICDCIELQKIISSILTTSKSDSIPKC